LQRRRSGERRHSERHGAERDCRWHQTRWDFRRFEKSHCHRDNDEDGDEQTYAAIGDDCSGQDNSEHGASGAKPLRHEAGDDGDGATIIHELAEHGAE